MHTHTHTLGGAIAKKLLVRPLCSPQLYKIKQAIATMVTTRSPRKRGVGCVDLTSDSSGDEGANSAKKRKAAAPTSPSKRTPSKRTPSSRNCIDLTCDSDEEDPPPLSFKNQNFPYCQEVLSPDSSDTEYPPLPPLPPAQSPPPTLMSSSRTKRKSSISTTNRSEPKKRNQTVAVVTPAAKKSATSTLVESFATELKKLDHHIEPPNEETCKHLLKKYDDVETATRLYVESIKALQYRASLDNPHALNIQAIANISHENTICYRVIRSEGPSAELDPMGRGLSPKSLGSKASIKSHVSGYVNTQYTSLSHGVASGPAEFSNKAEKKGVDPKKILIVVAALDFGEENKDGKLVNTDISGNSKASDKLRTENQIDIMHSRGHWPFVTNEVVHEGHLNKENVLCVVPWSEVRGAWLKNGKLLCLGVDCPNLPVDKYVCRECDKFEVIGQARFPTCIEAGCDISSVVGFDFCTKHGGVTLKCSEDGCTNNAIWCYKKNCIETCRKHGSNPKFYRRMH